jgi:transcriptional regulator with PAS, ATPase and Fis domain
VSENAWVKEFPCSVTVCDTEGRILEMNDRSAEVFASDGGRGLIGTNVLDCHPEPARTQLKDMLAAGLTNVYTIKKNGRKKLIYQAPWSESGHYAGFVEIAVEIPWDMPHFDRDGKAGS